MTCAASMRISSCELWGSPDVGGWLRQSTRLELAVNVDSGYNVENARVNKGGVASKSKFCGWVSDDGVLELLEGRRRDLAHRHFYPNGDLSNIEGTDLVNGRVPSRVGLWISTWPVYTLSRPPFLFSLV